MKKALWLAGLLCSASFMANATTISYAADCTGVATPCTVVATMQHGLTPTNWTFNPIYPQFNPTLGTLNSITFKLDGNMQATVGYENLSSTVGGSTQNANIQSEVGFTRPDTSVIVFTLPGQFVATKITYAKYDGTTDYGPNTRPSATSSGYTYNASGADTASDTTALAADLLAHTGVGNVTDWVFYANDLVSVVVSGGSFTSTKQVDAKAMLAVTYNYTETTTIPEPATSALAGGALLLLGVFARRVRR